MKKKLHIPWYFIVIPILFFWGTIGVSNSRAQNFVFGKNRVKYHEFNWRYIQSKHFDVYYYTSQNYDLATFAAINLEASLKQIQQDFGSKITNRIPVFVYDAQAAFQRTNVAPLPIQAQGIVGVTEPFKNRVVVPFDGKYDAFRSTLQHELVHAAINDIFYGGNVQSRLGGGAIRIPQWFNEGMAEHESRGFDTETAMWVRNAIIQDYLPSLSQIPPGSFWAYRGGESFWHYIVLTYGRNKITEIIQKMQQYRSVQAAFQSALGMTIDEVSKKWKDFYKKRYSQAVSNRQSLSDIGTKLTKEGVAGVFTTSPAFSPQGDKIVLITNKNRGISQVIVVNAITGKKIKTLVSSTGNTNFEYFNIMQPNVSWSPNGERLALSATAKGKQQLAIVDYDTGNINYIRFKNVDGIGGVAWSPDGERIAFAGHTGPFSDLYLYNLKTHQLKNLTNDVFSDRQPVWGPKGKKIYFVSARGNHLQLGQAKDNVRLLTTDNMYSTDLYVLNVGSNRVQRLTNTPNWNETQPKTTRKGRLVFISDQNGIPNVYELHLASRTVTPLTNLQTGAMQISITPDGSRLAVLTIGKKGRDIYIITAPFAKAIHHPLKKNLWAQHRDSQSYSQMVPAIGYVKKLASGKQFLGLNKPSKKAKTSLIDSLMAAKVDTTKGLNKPNIAKPDTTKPDTTKKQNPNNLNFRNYVFSSNVLHDTTFTNKYLTNNVFEIEDNTTTDDRFIPHAYRIKFTPDLVYGSGNFGTYYGVGGLVELRFSDLLGNYILAVGSNLQFNLRNSIYSFTFANLKHRWKWIYNVSHFSYSPTYAFSNEALRYRYFKGQVTASYPFNTYTRIEFSLAGVNIAQDYTIQGAFYTDNENLSFAYPQITFVKDKSIRGLLTPISGFRYAVRLSASPPITSKTLQFESIYGDFRKYFHIGGPYSFAVRASAGMSFGQDPQTYILGGMQGWLNRKYADFSIPRSTLQRSFLSPLIGPLRGFPYFALHGSKFGLVNMEFRFPLFAGLLPGPIPILPLFNITGVAFIDAGTAWGQDVNYRVGRGAQGIYYTNDSSLNFKLRKKGVDKNITTVNGKHPPMPKGDILIGAGFGLRAVIFGRIPLRWDIGWPYYRDGFGSHPINYISIGIDF